MKNAKVERIWSYEITEPGSSFGWWHIEESGDDFRVDGPGVESFVLPGSVATAMAKLIVKKAAQ